MQRAKNLPALTSSQNFPEMDCAFGNCETGAAWLSSARVVKCWVKSRNDATLSLLPAIRSGTVSETASDKLEEGDDVVIMALHDQYTHATMALRQREATSREQSGPHKVRQSDWSSQLDSSEVGTLVIVDQNAGEYVPGLAISPPVTPWEWVFVKEVGSFNLREGATTL